MKVADYIKLTAELLGESVLKKVEAYLNDGNSIGMYLVVELLSSFECVQEELASKYIPLRTQEEIETETGAVPYSALSKSAVQIVRVTDEWGTPVRFDLYDEYFKTRVGRIKVTYTYLPGKVGTNNESAFELYVTKHLIAYGMAANYCLKKGMYDEAEMWDKKYKTSIRDVYRKAPCKKIPVREWK